VRARVRWPEPVLGATSCPRELIYQAATLFKTKKVNGRGISNLSKAMKLGDASRLGWRRTRSGLCHRVWQARSFGTNDCIFMTHTFIIVRYVEEIYQDIQRENPEITQKKTGIHNRKQQ
jgi:hypothetical protein